MSTNNDKQSSNEQEHYQQVNHEKNAFVAGDKVYIWKNIKGKPIRVWRTVKSVDVVEGKLYFEDGKRGVTVCGPKEEKHDNIITTDAWEKAFALLDEAWTKEEARENRMNSVVSCETIDGIPCVIICNRKENVHKKWFIRRDWWSLLKKEDTSLERKRIFKGKVGEPKAVKTTANANPRLYVDLPEDEDCIITDTKGKFYAWNLESIYVIGYLCPWLKEMDAPWATEVGNLKVYNPFKIKEIKELFPACLSDDGETLERCPNVEKFEIPEGVTTIFEEAFLDCPNLQEVYLPSTVTTIADSNGNLSFSYNIFSECPLLRKIVISPKNKVYDSRDNCNAIIETVSGGYSIEDDGEEIENLPVIHLSHACSSSNIPNGVDVIDEGAFEGCSLKEIFIPESVGAINCSDFGSSLERIIVSDKNIIFDSRENCNAIIETSTNTLVLGCSNTRVPNSVVCIRGGAFANCEKLKSIIIPQNVVRIREGAFSGTPALQEIIVDDFNRYYDSRDNCNAIIETTNNILIAGCKTTIIPKTVKKIGKFAFRGCSSLESIVIPEGVKEIGEEAFGFCPALLEIHLSSSIMEIGPSIFENDPLDGYITRRVFVPKGEKDRFKAMGLDGENIILIEE